MAEIVLSSNKLSIGILPELGATLSFLRYNHGSEVYDILRPTTGPVSDPNLTAMFPMLPYCGRIRGGAFTYWGILRKVPKTHAGFTEPIHGDGWITPWEVVSQSANEVTLRMAHDKKENGFPFSYTAEITYTLTGDELSVKITVHNPSPLPMPCGFGVHPFFVRTKDVILNYKSQVVWSNESDPIFDDPYTTPAAWNFDGGKPLNNAVFDTCFGGFEEKAEIIYPDKNLKVSIQTTDMFHHVVLYAPKGKNFFCLEPCSLAANAFNLASDGVIGTGIRSIGPNQDLTGKISFKVQG